MVRKAAHSTEVFEMDIDNTQTGAEAQEILEALTQIQQDDELRAAAETDPAGVLDRLELSGIARHAVAFGIAGLLVGGSVVKPMGWWAT
jgi:hypothetical protein